MLGRSRRQKSGCVDRENADRGAAVFVYIQTQENLRAWRLTAEIVQTKHEYQIDNIVQSYYILLYIYLRMREIPF